MKHATLALCLCLSLGAASQTREYPSVALPKDNGKTVSFCEDINVGQDASDYFTAACNRLRSAEDARNIWEGDDVMTVSFFYNESGHGVMSTLKVFLCGPYVNYVFDEFYVDRQPIDQWLTTAAPFVVSQVQSTVYLRTVMVIATMKGTRTSTSSYLAR
jgi:hypothetical protein